MLYNRPTHEIWIEIQDNTGALYGEALIGIAFTNDDGQIVPKFAATPLPGTLTTFRPIPVETPD